MSENIMQEIYFLLHSIVCGVLITFIYDWIRVLRRVFKHNLFFISAEDLVFWIACSLSIFLMLYQENNGTLRWFAIIGAAIGMALYHLTLSRYFLRYVSMGLSAILGIVGKLLLIVLKPAAALLKTEAKVVKKTWVRMKKLCGILKNRLTQGIKMIKILVHKQ